MNELKGKTALITGANRGIGKEIVSTLAREGCDIIAHSRKEYQEFKDFIEEIKCSFSVNVDTVYFDMLDTDAMTNAIKPFVLDKSRHIDILVNNAGIAHGGMFEMTKVQTIKEVFDVNLFSAMELTQLVIRKMRRQKEGCIINLSSVAGINLRAGNSAYGVSKAAVKAWTETLAMELADGGIRVNAVAPGLTDTAMASQMEDKAGMEMVNASAMRRLAETEEIANVILFLASEKSSFVNGQTIVVNGGGI